MRTLALRRAVGVAAAGAAALTQHKFCSAHAAAARQAADDNDPHRWLEEIEGEGPLRWVKKEAARAIQHIGGMRVATLDPIRPSLLRRTADL